MQSLSRKHQTGSSANYLFAKPPAIESHFSSANHLRQAAGNREPLPERPTGNAGTSTSRRRPKTLAAM